MKALVVSAISPDFSGCGIAECAVPARGPGQVLIRVRAASINFPDLLMIRGLYQLKPDIPFIPGIDVAGDIVEADAASGFAPGDAVVGATRLGGLAEFVVIDAKMVRRKPENLDYARAAAFGAAYLTAYVALIRWGDLKPGQWVLVHGAAGGVGLAAVDLALALGAKVIAGSASAAKRAIVAEEYKPNAALVTEPGFAQKVKELTGGGADLIYDPVGGDIFDESTRCVAFGGRLLVIGFTSGRIPTIRTNIALLKGFSICGVRAGEYGRRFPERGQENLDAIWAMAAAGRLRPRVHADYPLAQWREAFAQMDSRAVIGKIILRPAGD